MAKSSKIKVMYCRECKKDYLTTNRYCWNYDVHKNLVDMQEIERDKRQVSSSFHIEDWFSSRGGAGLVIVDEAGLRYKMYMSDLFQFLKNKKLGEFTIEEVKKGTAYGWKVLE